MECVYQQTHTRPHTCMHAYAPPPPPHTHTHMHIHTHTHTQQQQNSEHNTHARAHIHHLSLWFELFAFTFSDKTFREFSDVCGHFLGRFAKLLATFSSLVTLLGGAIVYWILLSNFLYNIVIFIYSKSAFCLRTGCVKFMLHCMINCVWVSKCLCVCVTTLYVCVCVCECARVCVWIQVQPSFWSSIVCKIISDSVIIIIIIDRFYIVLSSRLAALTCDFTWVNSFL